MTGISTLLTRQCKQVAVYWGNPVKDGQGGFTFAEPVEIYCRWEEMNQIVTDAKGNELTSRALVYTLQDVDEEGYLYLGTLENLYDSMPDAESSEGGLDKPQDIEGAYIIKRFQKVPALGSTTEFVRKAYLTPSLSFGGF
jgi:hypothetical protein